MLGFIVGLLLGVGGKIIYDLFKEEQLPMASGLNTGRIESLLDETRQIVREVRDEVRQAASAGKDSVQEKASRLLSSATEADKGESGQSASQGAAGSEPRLTVTSSGSESSGSGSGSGSSTGGSSSAGSGGSGSGGSSGTTTGGGQTNP